MTRPRSEISLILSFFSTEALMVLIVALCCGYCLTAAIQEYRRSNPTQFLRLIVTAFAAFAIVHADTHTNLTQPYQNIWLLVWGSVGAWAGWSFCLATTDESRQQFAKYLWLFGMFIAIPAALTTALDARDRQDDQIMQQVDSPDRRFTAFLVERREYEWNYYYVGVESHVIMNKWG